jgi:hypothetical protein
MMVYRSVRRWALWWSVIALAIVQTASPAWAWGRLGHRVIARIAERHLRLEAREAIRALVPEGESLADASTWAGEQRGTRDSAARHYVDVPLNEPRYDARFSGPDASHGCIVDKIAEFRAVLKNPSESLKQKQFALRYLVHLVGDLLQPLHIGDNNDGGGNDMQVRWFDYGSNLHKVWDLDQIESVGRQNRGVLGAGSREARHGR